MISYYDYLNGNIEELISMLEDEDKNPNEELIKKTLDRCEKLDDLISPDAMNYSESLTSIAFEYFALSLGWVSINMRKDIIYAFAELNDSLAITIKSKLGNGIDSYVDLNFVEDDQTTGIAEALLLNSLDSNVYESLIEKYSK